MFLACLLFTLSQKIRKESEKVTIPILGIGIDFTSSSTVLLVIWEVYQNISKGKCNILQLLLLRLDSYHWFFLLIMIRFTCFNILQYDHTEKYSVVIIYIPVASKELYVDLRVNLIVVSDIGLLLENYLYYCD